LHARDALRATQRGTPIDQRKQRSCSRAQSEAQTKERRAVATSTESLQPSSPPPL